MRMFMIIVIRTKTGKGKKSSEEDVKKTYRIALFIAQRLHGKIIYGKGYSDGTKLELLKH